MPSQSAKLAWAAGFIDGEGCISLQRGSVVSGQGWRSMTLTLRVSQKYRTPLDVLASLFGGNIRLRASKQCFEWTLSARNAAYALEQLLPYLVLKHDQAELAIAYQDLVSRHSGSRRLTPEERMVREFAFEELKALKLGT